MRNCLSPGWKEQGLAPCRPRSQHSGAAHLSCGLAATLVVPSDGSSSHSPKTHSCLQGGQRFWQIWGNFSALGSTSYGVIFPIY